MSIWPYVRSLFHELQEDIQPEALQRLLGYEQAVDKKVVETLDAEISNPRLALIKRMRKQREPTDKVRHFEKTQGIAGAIKWILEQLKCVKEGIAGNKPFPDEYEGREFQCMVLINTLIYDRWHENGGRTKKRTSGYKFAFYLWKLQMGYRLWSRMSIIFGSTDEVSPARFPLIHFDNRHMFKLPEGNYDTPVIRLTHGEVYLLMRSLSDERHGLNRLNLEKRSNINFFDRFWCAVMDTLAVFAHYNFVSDGKSRLDDNHEWFVKLVNTSSDTLNLAPSNQLTDADNVQASIQKEIIRVRKQQRDQIARESAMYDFSADSRASEFISMSLIKQIEDGNDLSEEKINSRIKWITMNINFMEEALLQEAPHGKKYTKYELIELAKADEQTLKSIAEYKEELAFLERTRVEQAAKREQEKADKLYQEKEHFLEGVKEDVKKAEQVHMNDIQYYACQTIWYKENMALSHHITIWQRQARNKINTFTDARIAARKLILMEVEKGLNSTSKYECLRNAEEWITDQRTEFWKREKLRLDKVGDADFKSGEAFVYSKTAAENEADNETPPFSLVQTANIKVLLDVETPYGFDTLAYAIIWWLGQTLTAIEISRTFIYWDIEYEFLNLARPFLLSPVISKSGSTWLIFKGGRWEDDRDEWLNCIWCGFDFADCLVEYVRLLRDDDWRITNRKDGSLCDLKGTQIHILSEQMDFENFDKT